MSLQVYVTPSTSTSLTTERWVLLAAVVASGMAFIDATAINVALPAIQSQFGATGTQLMWIINAYGLMVASLLLLGGSLGDRFGRKRLFMGGVTLFATGSLACGVAPGVESLIAARAGQGVGAAFMLPGSLSLISTTFEPSRRGRAIGIWSALCVVMTTLGPLLGGWFSQAGFWRGVFLINLPLAALCLVILKTKVPRDRPQARSTSLDYAGGALSVVGLSALCYGLIESTNRGWNDPLILAGMLIGIVCLGSLAWVERRTDDPLLPMSLFCDRTMIAASVMTLCFYSGIFGMMFLLSLNLIQIQDYTAVQAGLAQVPLMALVLLFSPLAGRLVDRVGPRFPIVLGGSLAVVGFVLLARPGVTAGPPEYGRSFLPALCLLGLAMGLCAAPLSTAIMNSVQQKHLGAASGINSMLSRLSSVLGIAILGPLTLQSFQTTLMSGAADLELNAHQLAILSSESADMADADPPPGLSQKKSSAVRSVIQLASVSAFRVVSIVCAVAVGLSTLLVAVLISPSPAE